MTIKELKAAYASGSRGAPLPDSSEVVPFGKHKGESIQVLLDDVRYLGWMCKQEGMVEDIAKRFPAFGQALINAVGSGAPALSKEEKAERRAELKAKAEEQRAKRAAKQANPPASRKRSCVEVGAVPSTDSHLIKLVKDVHLINTHIGQRIRRVTAAELQTATPGQRYLLELVTEAYQRSVAILGAVPEDVPEDAYKQAFLDAYDSVRTLWKDLPAPSDWWFRKEPILPVRKPRADLSSLSIRTCRRP